MDDSPPLARVQEEFPDTTRACVQLNGLPEFEGSSLPLMQSHSSHIQILQIGLLCNLLLKLSDALVF